MLDGGSVALSLCTRKTRSLPANHALRSRSTPAALLHTRHAHKAWARSTDAYHFPLAEVARRSRLLQAEVGILQFAPEACTRRGQDGVNGHGVTSAVGLLPSSLPSVRITVDLRASTVSLPPP